MSAPSYAVKYFKRWHMLKEDATCELCEQVIRCREGSTSRLRLHFKSMHTKIPSESPPKGPRILAHTSSTLLWAEHWQRLKRMMDWHSTIWRDTHISGESFWNITSFPKTGWRRSYKTWWNVARTLLFLFVITLMGLNLNGLETCWNICMTRNQVTMQAERV